MKSKLAALCVLLVIIYITTGYAGAEEAKAVQQEVPFYFNWTFWQWTVSLSALFISITPYIVRYIKGTSISLDVINKIVIHHTIGNPNINLFLIIQNNGGLPVKITKIALEICKDEKTYTIPAQSYFPEASENKQAILAPFRLLPEQGWTHGVYFYPDFTREDDIKFRKMRGELKANIQSKPIVMATSQPATQTPLTEADPQYLAPVMDFFNNHFMWSMGEYTGTVTIHAEPNKATIMKKFRFHLYDTESTELRNYSADYKYGLGVYDFNLEKHPSIFVTTSELK